MNERQVSERMCYKRARNVYADALDRGSNTVSPDGVFGLSLTAVESHLTRR